MDYQAELFDPVYDEFAVSATLDLGSQGSFTVSAIDLTAGVELPDNSGLLTVRPIATVRVAELTDNGIALADLDNGLLGLNGKSWRVKAVEPQPSPKGELDGEARLVLVEEAT